MMSTVFFEPPLTLAKNFVFSFRFSLVVPRHFRLLFGACKSGDLNDFMPPLTTAEDDEDDGSDEIDSISGRLDWDGAPSLDCWCN